MQHWQEVDATLAGSECNTGRKWMQHWQEVDATLQTQLLHACLKKTCDAIVLTDVCDIIATVKGNPRMKSFGEHMKMEWEKGVCCHSVCACACVERVNVYCMCTCMWHCTRQGCLLLLNVVEGASH